MRTRSSLSGSGRLALLALRHCCSACAAYPRHIRGISALYPRCAVRARSVVSAAGCSSLAGAAAHCPNNSRCSARENIRHETSTAVKSSDVFPHGLVVCCDAARFMLQQRLRAAKVASSSRSCSRGLAKCSTTLTHSCACSSVRLAAMPSVIDSHRNVAATRKYRSHPHCRRDWNVCRHYLRFTANSASANRSDSRAVAPPPPPDSTTRSGWRTFAPDTLCALLIES